MQLIKEIESRRDKKGFLRKWGKFKCLICLQEVERQFSALISESCGCNKNVKHGETKTRLYFVWANMKHRILNPNCKVYKDYGGRGITICDEWLEFIPFRDWSLSNGYKEGLTIDRKENDGNYEPSNCRWILGKENSQKRRTVKLTQEKADEIRALHATGLYTRRELAKMFNVSQQHVSDIINNKRWVNK